MSKHFVGYIGDGQDVEDDDDGSDNSSSDPVPIDLSVDSSLSRVKDGIIRVDEKIKSQQRNVQVYGVITQSSSSSKCEDESPVDLVRRRSTRLSKSSSDGQISNTANNNSVLPTHVWSVCDLCDATLTSEDDLQEHLRVTHKVTKKFNGLRQVFLPFTGARVPPSLGQSSSLSLTTPVVTRQSVIIRSSNPSSSSTSFTSNISSSSDNLYNSSFVPHHETRQYHNNSRHSYPQTTRLPSAASATATSESEESHYGLLGRPSLEPSLAATSGSSASTAQIQPTFSPVVTAAPTQDGRFPCTICNKQLSSRAALIGHLRVHTGEKPHQCSICSRAFSSSQTLTRHLRTHSGEKPYECPICGKRASLRHNMKLHMKIHQKADKRYSQQ